MRGLSEDRGASQATRPQGSRRPPGLRPALSPNPAQKLTRLQPVPPTARRPAATHPETANQGGQDRRQETQRAAGQKRSEEDKPHPFLSKKATTLSLLSLCLSLTHTHTHTESHTQEHTYIHTGTHT